MTLLTQFAGRLRERCLAVALALSVIGGVMVPIASAQGLPASTSLQQQDIAMFRERFMASDKSYTPEARAEAERRLAALEAQAGAVSDAAFVLELSRIVAP